MEITPWSNKCNFMFCVFINNISRIKWCKKLWVGKGGILENGKKKGISNKMLDSCCFFFFRTKIRCRLSKRIIIKLNDRLPAHFWCCCCPCIISKVSCCESSEKRCGNIYGSHLPWTSIHKSSTTMKCHAECVCVCAVKLVIMSCLRGGGGGDEEEEEQEQ